MRIVIDMQGAQTDSRFRGIGRYTLSLTRAIIRQAGEHEIILSLNGHFPDSVKRIREHFQGLLPSHHIVVWHAPSALGGAGVAIEEKQRLAEIVREAFLASLQPDVVHISSLFEGFTDESITSIGQLEADTVVSVIIYDLIPLLNPEQYLKHNKQFERHYRNKIAHLQRASHYFAISEFSKQESVDTLSIDQADVTNIFGAIDEDLQSYRESSLLDDISLKALGIDRNYILHTGGGDERKNLPRLIQAYAKLPLELRESHQLVFAGRMLPMIRTQLQACATSAGLQTGELIFTEFISDAVLAKLYSNCSLYVFPSRHEGLGLPAMEAMAFDAPVIAAKTSSLPEVIDKPDALFDPFDVDDICAKICQVLQNDAFRDELVRHGKQRAQQFSWDESARRAIHAWEELSRHKPHPSNQWAEIQKSQEQLYRLTIGSLAPSLDVKTEQSVLQALALCLAQNERQALDMLRRKPLNTPIQWRVEGPFDSSYSLALVNREVARGLKACGQLVSLHSTEGPGDFVPNQTFLSANPDINAMYQQSLQQTPLDVEVTSRNLYPPRVLDLNSRLNFMHAYGWEETGFPLQWANDFNAALQGMTVISEHVRKVMLDHGVMVPIVVSHDGVDHWDAIVANPDYKLNAKSFRFLHVSSCFPRKGVDVMLNAYGQAFSADDDVTLIIKTFKNPHNEVHRWLDQARADRLDFPDVVILEEDFSDSTLKALYAQCHALVAPSRAEGFGLPMAEAMLSNLAVITTGWGGQVDFCTHQTAWLIDYSFSKAQTHFNLTNSVWAEPNQRHLSTLMREVFSLPDELRSERIVAGQRLLRNQFTWKHVAKRMIRAAQNCANSPSLDEPRIGWVTTWNTRCGIASYSEHLIENMPAEVTVLAANTDTAVKPDSTQVKRCWSASEDESLFDLMREIEENDLDIVVIQFNYGFFNFTYFAEALDELVQSGRIVVVTLHATIDPPTLPHKQLQMLADSLARCARVLVHSDADLNRLKDLGVVNNVTLFPHGILDFVAPHNTPTSAKGGFSIASFGFFLPNKGLLELIDAVAILRDQNRQCQLTMLNAAYPSEESRNLLEHARQKVTAHGLADRVSIVSDYLNDTQSLEILCQSDLIVFPYQETGESASGAVRFGIASGRVVAVTPLTVFNDVRNLVHRLPGTTPVDIAKGIAQLADISNNFTMPLEQQVQTNEWLEELRYSRLGKRLHSMLRALHFDRHRPV